MPQVPGVKGKGAMNHDQVREQAPRVWASISQARTWVGKTSIGSSSWGQEIALYNLKGSCKMKNQAGIKGQGKEKIENPGLHVSYQPAKYHIMNIEEQG